jgi:xanthine dehydrogenase accessory factor
MRDVTPVLDSWLGGDGPLALSTVVHTWGSGPRRPGARMTVDGRGRIAGSVSGGCVESSVVEAAREVIATGEPRLLRFAVSDELAWGVGLACGGALAVFVERAQREQIAHLREGMRRRLPVAFAVATSGPGVGDSLVMTAGSPGVGAPRLTEVAEAALASGAPLASDTEHGSVFCDVILPPESLVIVGGVHIAQTLCGLAAQVGYRPVVCDPRPVFASAERFPEVEVVNDWPEDGFRRIGLDASTAVATLTHDPKLDDPALAAALESPAFYVGALGSRMTHARRLARLRERGVSETSLARIAAPIGLPIGARTPDQIALAVMAEVVAARNGARGQPVG